MSENYREYLESVFKEYKNMQMGPSWAVVAAIMVIAHILLDQRRNS